MKMMLEQTGIGCNENVRVGSMRIVWTMRTLVHMELSASFYYSAFVVVVVFPVYYVLCVVLKNKLLWYNIW